MNVAFRIEPVIKRYVFRSDYKKIIENKINKFGSAGICRRK